MSGKLLLEKEPNEVFEGTDEQCLIIKKRKDKHATTFGTKQKI